MDASLHLRVVTPSGIFAEADGTSAHLPLSEDKAGRGAGDYNIRPGHIDAVLALKSGRVTLLDNGREVLRAAIPDGFALVEKNRITVLSGSAE